MTLSTAINKALSGVNATSVLVDVTAGNISNASTENYSRRIAELSSVSLGLTGGGVRVASVELATVENITNDRRRAEAEFSKQSTLTDAYAAIDRVIGDVGEAGSLFSLYEAFEASLRDVADKPESTLAQSNVVSDARELVDFFNEANDEIREMREQADAEIARQVADLNTALANLKETEAEITRNTAAGVDATEGLAARQEIIDDIAEIVPIVVETQDNGAVKIFTKGGLPLLDPSAAEFDFTAATVVTADQDYLAGVGSLSGIETRGIDVTPGNGSAYAALEGGTLAAQFYVRDVLTVDLQTQLDAIAADLIDRFDDNVGVDPTLTPGDPGLFTDAGVAYTGVVGLAGRIEINAAVDPTQGGEVWRIRDGIGAAAEGVAGDNAIPVALLNAFTATNAAPAASGVNGNRSSTDLVAEFTSLLFSASENAEIDLATRAARYNTLRSSELAAIGVNIDTELATLTILEQAYAANAQVLAVVDELFDLLLRR